MIDKNLIDLKPLCEVKPCPGWNCYMVTYKGVPLWSTVYPNLDGCEIHLNQCDDEICIVGKTPVYYEPTQFDLSTYGMWFTEEEARAWLDNPVPLY